jgi:hypothetical protein
MNRIISPFLGPITYPAAMLTAFLYLWCAGEIKLALIQSMIGAAGTAVGWATK